VQNLKLIKFLSLFQPSGRPTYIINNEHEMY